MTNPPLDAIREELVTSLLPPLGPEGNLLEPTARVVPPDRAAHARSSTTTTWPSCSTSTSTARRPGFRAFAIDGLFDGGRAAATALRGRPSRTCAGRSARPSPTAPNIIVLSDRNSTAELAPIPSLLLTAAVHHHLVREKTRTRVGLVVETGDAREVHHMALLIGFGAAAVNPYLAFETIDDMIADGLLDGVVPAPGPEQLHQGGLPRASSR